ncbi:MAG: STAS domain-containing protein [Phycisphaeraceae bacterium]|nr:STAS domain-containing protein [Phycisphaeraceae bacterium]MCW5753278.1 STAS domain-containing protein [Phycisphaeraceae bacterium]
MHEGSGIEIELRQHADAAIVVARGDIDMSGSPLLRENLRQALASRINRVVVDLGGVEYMDSSGLATLVEALKNAKTAGTRLLLCNMRDRVRAIFEIARLDKFFTIASTQDEALSA